MTKPTKDFNDHWETFFASDDVKFVLETMNFILECLDPEFVDLLEDLNTKMKMKHKGTASSILANHCHIHGMSAHSNLRGKRHEDGASLNLGWDLVQAFGLFSDCEFEFSDLRTRANFLPTDFMALRGGSLTHTAHGWKGAGRFVLVPFIERRLFPRFAVDKPRQLKPFYPKYRKHIRAMFPPIDLHTL